MDYWSCGDGGDLLFSEDGKAIENFPLNFDGDDISIDTQAIKSLDFMDLGLSEMMRKLLPYGPSMETCGIINSDNGSVFSPGCLITPNSLLGDVESGTGVLSSVVELRSQSSSSMSLNPGTLADCGDANNNSSNKGSVLSPLSSSRSNKRARVANLYSQAPFCQVYGCGVDLSSSKEYYKKHRVCILHTKTARVIVDGIEQRFCQQCSRFHLLDEFDDGKRSCRKRLEGHNQRRRKPQFDSAINEQKFLQSYQDIIPGGVLFPDTHKMINWSKPAELNAGSKYSPQFAMVIAKRKLLPASAHFHHRNSRGKPSRITSKGAKGFSLINAALSVRKLPEASRASCALSLLSTHSQGSQNHSAGTQLDGSTTFQNNSVIKNVDKLLGVRPLEEESFPPAWILSSGVNYLKNDQISPISGLDVGVHEEELSRRSNYLERKNFISPEQGPTVDLFQLSSNLQMVEYQRNMFNQSDFLIPQL